MTEFEKYLFDLQGYLVLEDVLSPQEVEELSQLIDKQNPEAPGSNIRSIGLGGFKPAEKAGFLEWGKPFCDLLDHPRIMPVLKFILSDGFRLDHFYGLQVGNGASGHNLHGGNTPYSHLGYYQHREGNMYNGLTVVTWNLVDSGPQYGGFRCIPGSHKSNYPCPEKFKASHKKENCIIVPEAKAGSVIIFTEALTHGSAPWTGKHQRRSLLFKYTPAEQIWAAVQPKPPANVKLTPRQKLLFERPYYANRRSLFGPEVILDEY